MQPSSSPFGPFVDEPWLAANLADVVVGDVRWYLDGRSGRAAFDAGHIPGAVFVDLDRDLASPPGGTAGRHPLPDPEQFARAMGALGIGDGTTVVAYDDSGGSTAARLVWMLRILGVRAAVLDGGLGGWRGALSTDERPRAPAHFTPRPWPVDAIVDADALARALEAGEVVAVDARAGERYLGEVEPIDPRAGHVPGARSLPWSTLTDPDSRRLRDRDELREAIRGVGIDDSTSVVAYCGSGVNACFDALAIEAAGLTRPRVFVASWSGWSSDPSRPVATGAEPEGSGR